MYLICNICINLQFFIVKWIGIQNNFVNLHAEI
jgi:hypothetical protein